MIQFFEHIRGRQEAGFGLEDAFRFKAVLSSRKKGTLQDSRYIEWPESEESEPEQRTVSGRRPARKPDPAPATDRRLANNEPALPPASEPALIPLDQPPVPSPVQIPPQYSFHTFQTNLQSLPHNADNLFLTLDPQFNVDARIDLDPCLDPAYDGHPYMNTVPGSTPALSTMPAHSYLLTPTLTPEPELSQGILPGPHEADIPKPASRPRRKGTNADKLAISEAKKILKKGKTRGRT